MENVALSKQHLECIFDSITDPIFSINPQHEITRLNKSYESATGRKFNEILGKTCYTQLYNRTEPCEQCPLNEMMKDGEVKNFIIEVDGKKIYKVNCFPLIEKMGQIVAMVEVIHDITDAERIKHEFEQLQHNILEKSVLLAGKNQELEKAYIKISQELKLAQLVQRGILPAELPRLPEINTRVFYLPMEEVGGDLYDFIQISKDLIGIILFDVSGHGIPAAFIAAMAKMSFYLHAMDYQSAAKVLSQVNKDMCDNLHTDEYFFSTSYCLIDLITNKIKCANAGHPPLLILRKKTTSLEEIKEKSIIMGITTEVKYNESEMQLQKGDRLVFYTDGIYECLNDNKELGFNRFCDILLASSHLSIDNQIDKIKESLKPFLDQEKPADDITLVIIEVAMENKFDYFKLSAHFANPDNVTILAIRHPLDFEKAISAVLHKMDDSFFHDLAIRNSKYAIYEALNLYYRSNLNLEETIYLAFQCTPQKCLMVIVDNRFITDSFEKDYFTKEENKISVTTIKNTIDKIEFFDGGKKIILEKHP